MSDDKVDKLLVCCECDQQFMWTVGEQAFYAERQLAAPKRCRACRAARRSQAQADVWRSEVSDVRPPRVVTRKRPGQ